MNLKPFTPEEERLIDESFEMQEWLEDKGEVEFPTGEFPRTEADFFESEWEYFCESPFRRP